MTVAASAQRPPASSRARSPIEAVEPFLVELERYQGPLELLLHLIRSQDIDIFDIPIARITRQFQAAIAAGLEDMPLERAGEFLEMAASLIRIKAQLLLPRPEKLDWEEDPRAELVRRLLEYEHFQDVVHVLERAEAQRGRHFGKGYIPDRPAPEGMRPELNAGLRDLLEAMQRVPEPPPPVRVRPPTKSVTVEEKMSLLGRLFENAKRVAFDRLFRPWGTRAHATAAFLAALEMAKQQLLRIEQTGPFAPIWLFAGGWVGGQSHASDELPGLAESADETADATDETADAPVDERTTGGVGGT